MVFWFRDIIREALYMGYHTTYVQSNLRLGFALFIVSEVMFFVSFFWAFFHSSIDPSIWGGTIWPPAGIVNFYISENISNMFFLSSLATTAETFFAALPNLISRDFYLSFIDQLLSLTNFANLLSFVSIGRIISGLGYFVDYFEIRWLFNSGCDIYFNEREGDSQNTFDALFYYSIRYEDIFEIIETLRDDSVYIPTIMSSIYNMFRKISDIISSIIDLNLSLYDSGTLIKPDRVPLINTLILLTSGALLTWSHRSLRAESFKETVISLNWVLFFAWIFMTVQFHEYMFANFSINDGIYGSTFFMLTGFHGIHVLIGSIFLFVCMCRFLLIHFTRAHHFGYEAAIWYWHFVDVIWVFLYLFIYFWPSNFFFDYSFNWSSFIPSILDYALPTKFLTYIDEHKELNYIFPLIEKFIEIKEDVFRRFSLAVPALITLGGIDDFYTDTGIDAELYELINSFIDNSSFNFVNYSDIFGLRNREQIGFAEVFIDVPLDTFSVDELEDDNISDEDFEKWYLDFVLNNQLPEPDVDEEEDHLSFEELFEKWYSVVLNNRLSEPDAGEEEDHLSFEELFEKWYSDYLRKYQLPEPDVGEEDFLSDGEFITDDNYILDDDGDIAAYYYISEEYNELEDIINNIDPEFLIQEWWEDIETLVETFIDNIEIDNFDDVEELYQEEIKGENLMELIACTEDEEENAEESVEPPISQGFDTTFDIFMDDTVDPDILLREIFFGKTFLPEELLFSNEEFDELDAIFADVEFDEEDYVFDDVEELYREIKGENLMELIACTEDEEEDAEESVEPPISQGFDTTFDIFMDDTIDPDILLREIFFGKTFPSEELLLSDDELDAIFADVEFDEEDFVLDDDEYESSNSGSSED
jgi:heme/copper-type cytochrome/quinol oxidase subunit 3/predicted secreted protein